MGLSLLSTSVVVDTHPGSRVDAIATSPSLPDRLVWMAGATAGCYVILPQGRWVHFMLSDIPHSYPRYLKGVPPATVAEWTLQGDRNRDFYDGKVVCMYRLLTILTTIYSVARGWRQHPDAHRE